MNSPTDATPPPPWNIEAARALYNIQRWGAKYFDINDAGHVIAKPLQDAGATVDITDVIEEAKSRGLKFPLLIRFQDILRHRVEAINLSFRNAIAEFNYQGKYRGVFPFRSEKPRTEISAAHPLSGYFAAPRRGDQPVVPQCHRGVQLSGEISRRVPNQGQPAPRSRGGNSGRGQAV